MFNPKQPLWLPAGSIRAIVALVLVGALVAGTGGDNVATLAAAVVAFYFGSKKPTP